MKLIVDVYKNRGMLYSLTKNEFRQRYLGNNLGIAWAFIQPVMTISILWFVFQVGFKAKPIEDIPFILWLIAGMIPWFFISDGLSSGINSVANNSFLVKKVVFNVELLPVISLLTVSFIHIAFILLLVLMFYSYGYPPSIYYFQLIYYMVMAFILLLSISLITSSVVLFFKDIGQIIALAIQFGFWVTPIFWSLDMIPEKYIRYIKLNPVVYIVEGYRNSFIYHKWFWQDISMSVYYWLVTIAIFIIGNITFKKLRPHFADVA
ncbi:MAG: ABC transporter permease [Turicibacter sp.]